MLDHLVLACPDLAGAVADFQRRTGVRPVVGGRHVGRGTVSHLVSLGGRAYLEIIGPDPEQCELDQPRPFGIDTLDRPRLVAWAVRVKGIEDWAARAREHGFDPGPVQRMSRRTADGELLEWQVTSRGLNRGDLVPFLIDWGATPHPTNRPLPVVPLIELTGTHPEPEAVRVALRALGVEMKVFPGERAALTASVSSRYGRVVLA
ncbi:VOC family protein [Gandjariella thermophila]|uniref:VOC domain-containing protein n=1 Tax=Gandjariella thermophila TaxID=1931992 RepID=A0A4D4J9S4_9PSEU|nr:VOC family protein [Gandjariella thermophila]GDY32314.1 hypothetical protein GTS_39470 [Gandjariella thermophila]